jgi:D-3-phosphoglycerate dehydrogenase / 2-oxoglutarate reductase
MNTLIADKFEASGIQGLEKLGGAVFYEPAAGAEGVGAALAKLRPDVLIVRSSTVTREAMEKAPSLRAIIRAGAGVDNIDVAAATERGIQVANCPGLNAVAVAELTIGLLIACDRRIPDQTADLRAGQWCKKEYGKARGLKGSVLGVVGPGAIGREVIRRALAFDMQIVAWSPLLTPQHAQEMGARFGGTDRAALLRMASQCDAITVHVPLTPQTRGLCDGAFFGAMKPGAIFVNTSRGGVVVESALLEAAASKGLRFGLDVYEGQPGTDGPWTTPLASAHGCAFTHHCGASTEQAQRAVAAEVVRLAEVFRDTGTLEHCVNPEAARGSGSRGAAQPV